MLPRGIRTNNPGNLRDAGNMWKGLVGADDGGYCIFCDLEHGIRALAKTLLNYQRIHKLKTIAQIIARWAPQSENDTSAYIEHVAKIMGVQPDEPIDLEREHTLCALVQVIIRHEVGYTPERKDWIDTPTIIKGVEMAMG